MESQLSPGRRQLVLAICCMSLFIVGLDNTIVNVALPSIQRSLHAGVTGLQWVIDAYTLVLAGLLMFSGSIADRIGRRRVFQCGLLLFTLGSLACSLAPGLGWLVGFRAMQAVGGSMLNPVAMSIITNTFTEPRERARAIGVWGAVSGISLALGPLLGGALVDGVGWRSIFWINIPIGLAALVLAAVFVPESRAARARRIDPVGQVLVVVILAALTYAIIDAPNAGWTSARTLGLFCVSAAGVVALVRYEPRRTEPLLDLRFFRSLPFAGATVIAVCGFAGLAGFLFLNTLYLQDARGYSALVAGLCTLPMAGMAVVFSPVSGRLVGSRGGRIPLVAAGSFGAVGCLCFTGLTLHTPLPLLIAGYLLFGVGFGLLNAPITNTAVSGMPRSQAGVAAAVASTSRQVGGSLGVAVLGSVATASVTAGPAAFTRATHVGWWILVGCGAAVALLGLLTTGGYARATARRVSERLGAEPDHPDDGPPLATTDARTPGE